MTAQSTNRILASLLVVAAFTAGAAIFVGLSPEQQNAVLGGFVGLVVLVSTATACEMAWRGVERARARRRGRRAERRAA